jgi:putative two-component system response regulator
MPNSESAILQDARILLVDDELANLRYLELALERAQYTQVLSTSDPRQVLDLYDSYQPDVLLLDLNMPHLDGFAVMEQLRAHTPPDDFVPILVLTADSSTEIKRRALAEGAQDYLTKPLDTIEVLLRVRNLLGMRFQHLLMEQKVAERTHELEEARQETLLRLALASEYRDDDTGLHTRRVGLTCARLAEGLGLAEDEVKLVHEAAPLHDVGKIGVPDAILLKPGHLTEEEFATMKGHTVIGAKMLSGSRSPWLQKAEEIAVSHHERWDGSGYPSGASGDEIPLSGRLVAVADVFDALTHDRPYKAAWPVERAVEEIRNQSGRQFDPEVIDVFLHLPEDALVF